MTSERDYQTEEALFDDIGDLNQLDFGGQSEEEVKEKIEYVEENLWTKLENTGKRISFAKDIIALYKYMKDPFVKPFSNTCIDTEESCRNFLINGLRSITGLSFSDENWRVCVCEGDT